jgi:predicted ATPase/class 3 adenylate cyclase
MNHDPDLPTGTVTFLFTDIEGSTSLWEQHPELMRAALTRHDVILRRAIEENGGHVFKTVGDAFCVAFATAPAALATAINAQRALHSQPWGETPIKVRMALHAGAAEERDGDYFGPPLNRVARLLAAGHGGQVLFSLAAQELVRDHLPSDAALRDVGERRLKDLVRPEHIFQLIVPDLPGDFPPLRTLDTRPNNLPVQATPFIGREREVEAARRRLLQPDVHLLTLTGPGGTGKTRLGLQIAADMLNDFADGVFFVPLARITDPGLVESAIAQELDVRELAGKSLTEILKDYLREKQLLLLLDNFEQVMPAAPLVGKLLAGAPRSKALVTSREALRLYGEHNYPVPSLAMPDPERLPPLERLTQYEAVQLFIQRAQAVRADFAVNNANAAAVAAICHRLDGLPLAIELAAARVRFLPPEALLARLESRLRLLTGGPRDLPARQQTLRGTIAWSYDLLNDGEKALFRRLAVFVGGSTLAAAEAVCGADGELPFEVLDGLEVLVDKNLLKQEAVGGEPRFAMLETIREYAAETLSEAGEANRMWKQHFSFYSQLAEDARVFLEKPEGAVWLAHLEREHDNLRAALDWARETRQVELEARLAEALCLFWFMRGYLTEGRERLMGLLSSQDGISDPPLRAKLLDRAGFLARYQGDYTGAYSLISEGLAISRRLDDRQMIADALANLGFVVLRQNDHVQARALYLEALTTHRELGNGQGIADSLSHLALISFHEGDYETARHYDEESLALWRDLGDQQGIAWALHRLGNVAFHQGDLATARALFRESLAIAGELGFRWGIACATEGLASLAAAQQQAERALRLVGFATALRQAISIPLPPAELAILERALVPARQALSDQAASVAWAEGQGMGLEEATRYALEQ